MLIIHEIHLSVDTCTTSNKLCKCTFGRTLENNFVSTSTRDKTGRTSFVRPFKYPNETWMHWSVVNTLINSEGKSTKTAISFSFFFLRDLVSIWVNLYLPSFSSLSTASVNEFLSKEILDQGKLRFHMDNRLQKLTKYFSFYVALAQVKHCDTYNNINIKCKVECKLRITTPYNAHQPTTWWKMVTISNI